MSPQLVILTTGPVANDPRATRAIAAAGAIAWPVTVIEAGGAADPEIPTNTRVVSINSSRAVDFLRAVLKRPWSSGAWAALRELRGIFRLVRLTLFTARVVRAARRVEGAGVIHANDLETLPAGWFLARRMHARLVYDAHELYTGFETDPPRFWLRVIWLIEGALARRADAVVTVSDGIADELSRRHHLPSRPHVVLNCAAIENVVVERHAGPVRAIYQAAAGPGRDLADLAAAAAAAPEVEIDARVLGANDLPYGVRRLEPVLPSDLIKGLAGYDVGLIIDRPQTENARLALPNKLFEYLTAGLAIVAPRLPAIAALVEGESVGTTYEPGRLGDALAELAHDRPRLDDMRQRARRAAVERYNAEAERSALYAAWGF